MGKEQSKPTQEEMDKCQAKVESLEELSLTIRMVIITLWSLNRQTLQYFLFVWRIIVMDPVTVTATDFGGFSRFYQR